MSQLVCLHSMPGREPALLPSGPADVPYDLCFRINGTGPGVPISKRDGGPCMAVPVLLPTNATDEAFAGVTYHIQGELVPALHIELGSAPVYFEHHILLWKDPAVQIGIKSLAGAFKRILSGMPVFMT